MSVELVHSVVNCTSTYIFSHNFAHSKLFMTAYQPFVIMSCLLYCKEMSGCHTDNTVSPVKGDNPVNLGRQSLQ